MSRFLTIQHKGFYCTIDTQEDLVQFMYTNYKGERSLRRGVVIPVKPHKDSQFHKGKFCIDMYDLDKQDVRSFCIADITDWTELPPINNTTISSRELPRSGYEQANN